MPGICTKCGTIILFGGAYEGGLRFCNDKCKHHYAIEKSLPEELIAIHIRKAHAGPCRKCGGDGPVDFTQYYWVYSLLLYGEHGTELHLVCRACAKKTRWSWVFKSLFGLLGPAFVFVPVQIFRNLRHLNDFPDVSAPSATMQHAVRAKLIEELYQSGFHEKLGEAAVTSEVSDHFNKFESDGR